MVEHGRGGFTLIELLVVVAIMAILMGLLLPVAHMVRAAGHCTVCRGNLRQLGQALSLYMDDHDDFIPRRGQGVRKLGKIDRMSDWFNCLPYYAGEPPYYEAIARGERPQEGDKSIFICPTARDPGWLYFLPYGMNMYISPWIRPAPHRLCELPRPSSLAFIADSPGDYCSTVPSKKEYSVEARHSGKANVLFLDSHVASFDGDYLGCGSGDPHRPDVRWETESGGVNQDPVE